MGANTITQGFSVGSLFFSHLTKNRSRLDTYRRVRDRLLPSADILSRRCLIATTYGFLSSILPYTNAEWEKLSIFLNFLLPKLPAPREEDLSKGILEAIDMDSYRVEKQAAQRVQLSDQDAEIDPVPTDGGGHKAEPELDRLSNIIRSFNDLFGNITWEDSDRIRRLIASEIPDKVAANAAYQNAKQNSDKQNARI